MDALMLARSLRYALIPGKPAFGSPALELHNKAYDFWFDLWLKAFDKIGQGERPKADDFLRADLISVILNQEKVVAVHLYSFFDLRQHGARGHSYFTGAYTPAAIKALESHNALNTVAFEYFSVAPEWRKSSNGISMGVTLLCMGFKFFEQTTADVILGISRIDLGVANLCYETGAVPLDKNVVVHGVPCDLVGFLQGAPNPQAKPAESDLADRLWKNRIDYSEEVLQVQTYQKAA